jgi:hypothetical protein
MTRRRRLVLVIAAIAIATVFAGVLLAPSLQRHWPVPPAWSRVPFDAAEWRAAKWEEGDTIRARMLRSLLQQHPLVGMSRSEVIGLLGTPEWTAGPSSGPPSSAQLDYAPTFTYALGLCNLVGMDVDVLVVRFDNDKVAGVQMVTWFD